MQNLIVLIELSKEAENISLKAGNMFLNRFSIDEDAAFELFGVYYLKSSVYNNVENEIKGKRNCNFNTWSC